MFDSFANPAQETRAVGAVDQAMVVGKRKWKHKARRVRHLAVRVTGLPLSAGNAEDCDLRPVDDGCKLRSADASEVSYRHGSALQFIQRDFLVPDALGGCIEFIRQLVDGLAVDVTDDRHDKPAVGINGDADVAIFL